MSDGIMVLHNVGGNSGVLMALTGDSSGDDRGAPSDVLSSHAGALTHVLLAMV
jgi:hypothetical protein